MNRAAEAVATLAARYEYNAGKALALETRNCWGVSTVVRRWAVFVCLFVLMFCLQGNAQTAGAQQKPATEAPSDSSQQSRQTASVAGVVMDASGATVAVAQV